MHTELTTIVIADDHPLIRAGMASLLQSTGSFALLGQASDGEQAVDLYQLLRPEILLMDMSMPGCDGIEATQRIRQPHRSRDAGQPARHAATGLTGLLIVVFDVPRR